MIPGTSRFTSKRYGASAIKYKEPAIMQPKTHRLWGDLSLVLFIVYLLILVWGILLKFDLPPFETEATRHYNLIPFYYEEEHSLRIHISEVMVNVLVFIPFGIYLCLFLGKMSLAGKAATFLSVSLALECLQFIFAIGRFDITDLITNTAGGLFGVCVFSIGKALLHDEEKTNRVLSVMVNIATLLFAGMVFLLLALN